MDNSKTTVIPIRKQIYEKIKDAILTNQYKPGDVVQIDKLAREFGVSATPIREALIRLENSGLLTLIPNKGAVVTEFTEKDVKNTWEMRKILEPYAARFAAKMNLASEIERLEKSVKRIIDGNYDMHFYIETDSNIHKILYNRLGNSLLKKTIKDIHHLSTRMRYFAESVPEDSKQVVHEVSKEHLAILEALKKGDPDACEQAVLNHVMNSEQRTLTSTSKDTHKQNS